MHLHCPRINLSRFSTQRNQADYTFRCSSTSFFCIKYIFSWRTGAGQVVLHKFHISWRTRTEAQATGTQPAQHPYGLVWLQSGGDEYRAGLICNCAKQGGSAVSYGRRKQTIPRLGITESKQSRF
jgi:hypothetical protein